MRDNVAPMAMHRFLEVTSSELFKLLKYHHENGGVIDSPEHDVCCGVYNALKENLMKKTPFHFTKHRIRLTQKINEKLGMFLDQVAAG